MLQHFSAAVTVAFSLIEISIAWVPYWCTARCWRKGKTSFLRQAEGGGVCLSHAGTQFCSSEPKSSASPGQHRWNLRGPWVLSSTVLKCDCFCCFGFRQDPVLLCSIVLLFPVGPSQQQVTEQLPGISQGLTFLSGDHSLVLKDSTGILALHVSVAKLRSSLLSALLDIVLQAFRSAGKPSIVSVPCLYILDER